MNIPEHPQIARALATGHPDPVTEPPTVYCEECGTVFDSDNKVFLYDGDRLCENCCRERIMEDFDMEDVAKALNIIVQALDQYIDQHQEEL